MQIFSLYQDTLNSLNTHQGGHMRPRNFNSWSNDISKKLFLELYGEWQKTQVVSDSLRPFFRSVNISVERPAGKAYGMIRYPADYEYFASARILVRGQETFPCAGLETMEGKTGEYVDPDEAALAKEHAADSLEEKPVKLVDNGRWGGLMENERKRPTLIKPAMTQFDSGFKVAPAAVTIIVLDYFVLPKQGLFSYTTGIDDQVIYDAANSKDMEWSESVQPYFIRQLGIRYGKHIGDQLTIQASGLQ